MKTLPKLSNLAGFRFSTGGVTKLTGGEKLLVLAVIASVGLDILTNVFNPSPVVAPLKGLILVLVVCSFRTIYSYLITLSFLEIFVLRELNIAVGQSDLGIIGDATFFLRILFFVTWLLLFYERRQSTTFLRSVLFISIATTILSVLCQVAGIVFHLQFFAAYAGLGRGGYKGLFLAENDTGVFYLITLIYSMYLWRKTGRWLYSVIVLAGMILLGLGSKTALFGVLIVPIVYFCFVHRFRSPFDLRLLAIRPRIAIWWAIVISVVGIIGYLGIRYLGEIFSFINYDQLLRVYQESGLLSSLLSYRDVKVAAYFHSIRSIPDVLFGLQLRSIPRGLIDARDAGVFMYEIDLFDYLARVGVIGTILTLGLIWRSAALRNWQSRTPELKTSVIIIALLGCTVGHTLISSMNGMWIGFWLIALGNLSSEKTLNSRRIDGSSTSEAGPHKVPPHVGRS